jgi:hypothetical protein
MLMEGLIKHRFEDDDDGGFVERMVQRLAHGHHACPGLGAANRLCPLTPHETA